MRIQVRTLCVQKIVNHKLKESCRFQNKSGSGQFFPDHEEIENNSDPQTRNLFAFQGSRLRMSWDLDKNLHSNLRLGTVPVLTSMSPKRIRYLSVQVQVQKCAQQNFNKTKKKSPYDMSNAISWLDLMVLSMHHQKSSSLSPLQAKTGMPASARAAATSFCVL